MLLCVKTGISCTCALRKYTYTVIVCCVNEAVLLLGQRFQRYNETRGLLVTPWSLQGSSARV